MSLLARFAATAPPGEHPLDRVAALLSKLKIQGPGNVALAKLRRTIAGAVRHELRAEVEEISDGLRSGDAQARQRLMTLADRALPEMRRRVHASRDGLLARLGARADAMFLDPHGTEHIDNLELDAELRTRAMEDLDGINGAFRLYDFFLHGLRPMLAPDRPTRVLDLAAGHGGFALAVARSAADAGLSLQILATDIHREYLELGDARAREEELDVSFAYQDALDLSNLEPGAHDVIVCTQSIHHFSPGMVAVMLSEAARVAARGVVFVDGCRSILAALPLVSFAALRFRNPILVHDAIVSFRRFFVPEELALLADLTPWGPATESRWQSPGHCLLRVALNR